MAAKFRDKFAAILAEDKKDLPETKELLDALDATLDKYAADIETLKKEKRTAAGGPTPEEIKEWERELAELRPLKDKAVELDRTVKTLTKEKELLNTQLGAEKTALRDYKNDSFMRKALMDTGIGKINPEDIDDAINHIQRKISYDKDGQKTFVTVTDEKGVEEQYPLEEYVTKVYPQTTHAKRFIPGGDDSGAGARGGGKGPGPSKSTIEQQYEAAKKSGNVPLMMSLKEQMAKGDNE